VDASKSFGPKLGCSRLIFFSSRCSFMVCLRILWLWFLSHELRHGRISRALIAFRTFERRTFRRSKFASKFAKFRVKGRSARRDLFVRLIDARCLRTDVCSRSRAVVEQRKLQRSGMKSINYRVALASDQSDRRRFSFSFRFGRNSPRRVAPTAPKCAESSSRLDEINSRFKGLATAMRYIVARRRRDR